MKRIERKFTSFMIIWAGQLLSRIGSGISAFALGIHILEKTGSTASFSLLLITAFLPPVLLGPACGVIADRVERKKLMIIGDLGSAAGILVVIAALILFPGLLWPLFIGISLSGAFSALHSPAFKAAVTDMLDDEQFSKAGGLIQLAEASRHLLAPAIAALLMTFLSMPVIMIIDALTFAAASTAVLLVRQGLRRPLQAEAVDGRAVLPGFKADLADGIVFLRGSRKLRRLLGITTLITFFVGMVQVLFTPIMLALSDARTLGNVQSLAATGMLISSLLIGVFSKSRNQQKVLTYSLAGTGLFLMMLGFNTRILMITIAAFGFFFVLPLVNTSLEVLFRQNIDSAIQGRVWANISFITQGGTLAALALTGIMADIINPLLLQAGVLADSVGKIVGTGEARGSCLLVIAAGFFILITGLFSARTESAGSEVKVLCQSQP